jgi:hypothetical protein
MTNIHPQPAQEERCMRPRRGAVLPFTKSADDPPTLVNLNKPKLQAIDQQNEQLKALKEDVDLLRRQNDLAIQTNMLVDLRLEQQQEKTLKTLERILSQLFDVIRRKRDAG